MSAARTRVVLAVGAALASCGDGRAPLPPPSPSLTVPALPGEHLGAEHGRLPHDPAADAVQAWLDEVDRALAAGDVDRALAALDADFARARNAARWARGAGTPVRLTIDPARPRVPLAGGTWAGLQLHAYATSPGTPSDTLDLGMAWIRRDGDGWRVSPGLPPGDARTTAVRGALWISPRRAWVVVDVTVTIEPGGLDLLPLSFVPVRTGAAPPDGVRLLEVSQDGAPCAFVADDGWLVVQPARAAPTIELRVRYEGEPSWGTTLQSSPDAVMLEGWYPRLGDGRAEDVDVTVHHPDGTITIGPSPATPAAGAAAGWVASRLAGRDLGFLVMVTPHHHADDRRVGALDTVFLGARPDGFDAELTRVLDALAPLGPLPLERVTFVAHDPFVGDRADARVAGQTVLLAAPRGPNATPERVLLAHELAHLWFGGAVPVGNPTMGRWWEALASYASLAALDADGARDERWRWLVRYAELGALDDVPITGRAPVGWTIPALSYAKAPLLLVALADRIGDDRMTAALRALLGRGDAPGSWDAVVDAVRGAAGDDAAAWLRAWLDHPSAPDLALADVRVAGGRVTGVLTQTTSPPLAGTVELALELDDGSRRVERVAFAGASTAIDLPAPVGARWLVLDPDARLPRRLPDDDRAVRAYLGVDRVRALGLALAQTPMGVSIAAVAPGSPAARAGLRRDGAAVVFLRELAGVATETVDDAYRALEARRPGDRITARIRRGDAARTVDLIVPPP